LFFCPRNYKTLGKELLIIITKETILHFDIHIRIFRIAGIA